MKIILQIYKYIYFRLKNYYRFTCFTVRYILFIISIISISYFILNFKRLFIILNKKLIFITILSRIIFFLSKILLILLITF